MLTFSELLTACLQGNNPLIWLDVRRERTRQLEQIVLMHGADRSPLCNVISVCTGRYRVVIAKKILATWLRREIEWNESGNKIVSGVSVAADVDWTVGTNSWANGAAAKRRHVARQAAAS